jgi:ComF family protein
MSAKSVLGRLAAGLLDVLAPPRCAACDEPCPRRSGFCSTCGLPKPAPPSELSGVPVVAGGLYEPPLVPALVRFKYGKRSELAPALADLIRPHAASLALTVRDAWVPVPLHPARLAERGYNQALLLARELARGTSAPVLPRLLRRESRTKRQASLGRNEREANVLGAFVVRGARRPDRVVLVDDVVTTGATAKACVAALAAEGIPVVAVAAVARSLPGSAA